MVPNRRGWCGVLAAAAATVALAACGGGSLPNSVGSVRVVNATSENATLDVYSGSKAVSTGVASYASSAYSELALLRVDR